MPRAGRAVFTRKVLTPPIATVASTSILSMDQDPDLASAETSRLYHNMMTPAGAYNGIDPGSTP